jgi:hypothetical protein
MSWAGTLADSRDGVTFTGAGNNDTTPTFGLLGGRYALIVHSSGTASAQLNVQAPDGSFVAAGAAVATTAVFDLPPGLYQIVMGASAGTQSGALIRVPFRAA